MVQEQAEQDAAKAARRKKRKKRSSEEELRQPRLLKLRDAARYLACSTGSLRTIVQSGRLPVIRGDGNSPWRVDVQDLDKFIEREKQTL